MSLVSLLKENAQRIAEEATSVLEETGGNNYTRLSMEQLLSQTKKTVDMFIYCIETGHDKDFTDYIREIGRERALQGYSLTEVQNAISIIREAFLNSLEKTSDEREEILRRSRIIMKVIDKGRIGISEAFLQTREEIIAQQRITLQELSTPVIPVFDDILVVPLIGAIDTSRARDILQNLLQGIIKENARIAILDVTGVPIIDTNVGHHLIKTVQAAGLLGCTCILVGIGPVVAQTIINLGVDFSNITTKRSLRQGLEYAFNLLNLEIRAINSYT